MAVIKERGTTGSTESLIRIFKSLSWWSLLQTGLLVAGRENERVQLSVLQRCSIYRQIAVSEGPNTPDFRPGKHQEIVRKGLEKENS